LHKVVPADAASESLDAVNRYACELDGFVTIINPWHLETFYGSGPAMVSEFPGRALVGRC
jgi:hypothetical protein